MRKYKILLYSLLLTALGCTIKGNNQNDTLERSSLFAKTDRLSFPLDSLMPPTTRYMDIYSNSITGSDELVYLNTNNDDMVFYDIQNGNKTKTIHFEKDGFDKVYTVYGFYIKNIDSIYVANYRFNVLLVNSNGEILRKYGDELSLPYSIWNYKRMAMIDDEHLVVHQAPMRWASRPAFWDENRTFVINTTTGEYDSVYTYHGKYKNNIYGQGVGGFWRFIEGGNGKYVYTFNFDENIYVTDFKDEEVYYAGSSYFDLVPEMPNPEPGNREVEHLINNNTYGPILYDKFNNVYYRFALHKASTPYPENDDYKSGKPFSIIVLDSEFNVLGESEVFKEGQYFYRNSFVYNGILYISTNNLNNELMDEDLLQFDGFSFNQDID